MSQEKGKNGNEWTRNDDGTLSPIDHPQLVLGFGETTRKCPGEANQPRQDLGIFAKGSPNAVVAKTGAFQLLMKNDETRALAFGDQWDNTDEYNMYSAALRLGSSVTAATFKFGEDGKHVSYLGDEYLGLHCNCNTWEAGEFVKSDSLP